MTGVRVVGHLCPTSDRRAFAGRETEVLARALADAAGVDVVLVGSPAEPPPATYDVDLRERRGCLLEAGGQIEDAIRDGVVPILVASTCSIAASTIPSVLRERPDAVVLWLDAHADMNTPDTTPSRFLGGMGLAAACGLWDAGLGFDRTLEPTRAALYGVRDVDPQEEALLDLHAVDVLTHPSHVLDAVRDAEVFIHLDLDVLDPELHPAEFPAPGGLTDGDLKVLLADVVREATVVGAEITAFTSPEHAELVVAAVAPLFESA